MKAMRLFAYAFSLSLVAGLAASGVAAQTKSAAKKAATAKPPAVSQRTIPAALLRPAALKEKAPEVYNVKFTTTRGEFVVRVRRAWAPLGADRFYNLVKHGFFNEASFFRVVPNFVVQFGISAYPQVSRAWLVAKIKDDPVKQKNKRGTITFATSGPNSRTTQVFINLHDRNVQLDGMGFSPFGEVVDGMGIVDQLYGGYGEATTGRQGEITQGGKAWLAKNFPKLDSIKSATLVPASAPPGGSPASPPSKP